MLAERRLDHGLRLSRIDARGQPNDERHVRPAIEIGQKIRLVADSHREWQRDLDGAARGHAFKPGSGHANDADLVSPDEERLADDLRIATEALGPEAIADHRDRCVSNRAVVL
jgi:hypothetical protein